jgi:hypothetical protein
MAGSTAREGAVGYATPFRSGAGDAARAGAAAPSGPRGRVTGSLLFRAGVGLLLGFLLTQPAISLTYTEQARAQRTHLAAHRLMDTDLDVQRLLLAMRTAEAGMTGYLASADPAFLRDYDAGQQDAMVARPDGPAAAVDHGVERGRGLSLARTAVDEVDYRRDGPTNRLTLVKRL